MGLNRVKSTEEWFRKATDSSNLLPGQTSQSFGGAIPPVRIDLIWAERVSNANQPVIGPTNAIGENRSAFAHPLRTCISDFSIVVYTPFQCLVVLDGLGLLLFVIPGVAAFAVDFSTGAIYLPIEPYYPGFGDTLQPYPAGGAPQAPPPYPAVPPPAAATSITPPPAQPTWQKLGLQQVVIPREELQQQRIEQLVSSHAGLQVSLDDSQARLSALPSIEQFDEQVRRHQSDRTFGLLLLLPAFILGPIGSAGGVQGLDNGLPVGRAFNLSHSHYFHASGAIRRRDHRRPAVPVL